jgi:peptidoglycan/xylan/chitin deacetylase (PgdA/CDA1 family)
MRNAYLFLYACAIFVLLSIPVPLSAAASTQVKDIALTFDDGPYGGPTAAILNILENEQVPATFFLIGKNVAEYPILARREVADGDEIGNHSYDHATNLATMSSEAFLTNLTKAEDIIASTTGTHATLFRPPYGSISPTMRGVLQKEGYSVAMWTVDPKDWDFANSSSTAIIDRVLSHVKANSIILLHDGRDTHVGYPRSNTIDALPILIADLKAQGYTFVTVDTLLDSSN